MQLETYQHYYYYYEEEEEEEEEEEKKKKKKKNFNRRDSHGYHGSKRYIRAYCKTQQQQQTGFSVQNNLLPE